MRRGKKNKTVYISSESRTGGQKRKSEKAKNRSHFVLVTHGLTERPTDTVSSRGTSPRQKNKGREVDCAEGYTNEEGEDGEEG